jgi:hypothetical protein
VKNKIKSIWRWVHNNQLNVKNKIQEQSMFWQVVMRFTQLARSVLLAEETGNPEKTEQN